MCLFFLKLLGTCIRHSSLSDISPLCLTPCSSRLLSYGSIVAGIVFGYGRAAAATMAYKYGVYLLPKQLDEKVAELHFPALCAALNVFAQEHPSSFLPDVVVFHEPVLLQLDLLKY